MYITLKRKSILNKTMLFRIIKSEIVSHLSYIVASKGEAFVVDPRRDCEIYVEAAQEWGVKIKDIFETHRNEDYVIGSIELSQMTGAKIHHGLGLDWVYGETLRDGEAFTIGLLKVVALHTPGHSPDSTCYSLYDVESGDEPIIVFTGDTLFVGDVGRTDFLGPENTAMMSGKLYDGIHDKLLSLGDGVVVYPAHGFGSVCGGAIKEREISTIGAERMMNPLLRLTRKEFIEHKVAERHEKSPYFKTMEKYNLEGPPILPHLPNPLALKPSEFQEVIEKGIPVIDTRPPPAFGGAHIKGAYSLPPSRLSNAGWVMPVENEILLVVDDARALDFAVRNLFRMGYSRFHGYLAGGMEAWYKEGLPLSKVELITSQQLKTMIDSGEPPVLVDVRRYSEWDEGHLRDAKHIYLGRLPERLGEVPEGKTVVVICKTGTRSSFAASVLLRAGRTKIYNLLGGVDSWRKLGYPLFKD
jgi:hydroxyacylglutathione hydrolase